MRTIGNFNLTPNITFYEYMEGQLPNLAKQWNWDYFSSINEKEQKMFIERARIVAQEVQKERDFVNDNYKKENENKEYSVIISCGFRCVKWELYRNRSGKGQHPIAAIDFKFGNCSIDQDAKLLKIVHDNRNKTWLGGLAIKKPTVVNKKVISSGFIHIDNRNPNREEKQRGYGTRWNY